MAGIRLGTEDLVFKLGNSDCKVYIGDTLLYQPYSPSGQTPCFEVVDALSAATGNYVDVYNNADNKWYKKNNLNQYEEYGIMQTVNSLSGVTYYTGKLVILSTDGHEYKWNGSSWTDLGALTGRLPIGYKELEHIENKNYSCINTGFKPNQDTRIVMTAQIVTSTNTGHFVGAGPFNQTGTLQFAYEPGTTGTMHVSWLNVAGWTEYSDCVGDFNVHTYDLNKNSLYRDNVLVGSTTYENYQCTNNLGILRHLEGNENPDASTTAASLIGKLFSFKMYDDGTLIRDLVPAKRSSDNKVGAYDVVNDVFYESIISNYPFTAGPEVTSGIPEDYQSKVAPANNVSYDTLEELEMMECPWVGMHATVGGVHYVYTANGWEVSAFKGWKYYLWHFKDIARSNEPIQYSEFDLVDTDTGQDVSLTLLSTNVPGYPSANETVEKLFDDNTSTKLCSPVDYTLISNNYIVFYAQSEFIPSTFSMTSANDSGNGVNRYATSWDLYASNTPSNDWTDGNWTKILSGTGGVEQKVNLVRFDYPISY